MNDQVLCIFQNGRITDELRSIMRDRTDRWTKTHRTIVENAFKEGYAICGNSEQNKYTTRMKGNAQFVISYNPKLKVFIVWNMAIREFLVKKKSMREFTIGVKGGEIIERVKHNDIVTYYKQIGKEPYKDCVERIIFIGADALGEFCQNFEYYFFPSSEDSYDGKKLLFAVPGGELIVLVSQNTIPEEIVREKEYFQRAKRNPKFREMVLSFFLNRCAVCGSVESNILQAAHITSVANGGDDTLDNGICLCANHHLMFDSGQLEIDFSKKTFCCNNTTEMKMPWYIDAEQRTFKLFWPDSE